MTTERLKKVGLSRVGTDTRGVSVYILAALVGTCASLASADDVKGDTSESSDKSTTARNTSESGSKGQRVRGSMEEIVVTAQRRESRLLDTPISIGVLSGEALDHGTSDGVSDALSQVGGVSITQGSPGSSTIIVRGVAAGAGTSTTAYYMDDVPFAFIRFPILPDLDAFDLARVEVLRGPQGTLYGASALGGVVRVLSNDAQLDGFEAKARMSASSTEEAAGNYGADLALNVPLVPGKLALRGVASYSELSGFVDSTFDGQRRINDSQTQSYRLKLNYQATERLSLKLGYSRSDIDNGADSASLPDYTTPFTSDQYSERVLDMYSLVAEYTWQDMSLLSSTGYADFTNSGQGVLAAPAGTLINEEALRSFSQELRLSSRLDGPWQWVAGAIYKDATQRTFNDPRPILPFSGGQVETSESYAVFGDVTRSFANNKFDVTAGVRYFEDRVGSTDTGDFFGRPLVPSVSMNFDHVTGRLVLAYKPSSSSTLYGSVVTGFRSGQNQTPSVRRTAPSFPPADPDELTTYELGAKGMLLDGIFTFESAVYYMDWKDIQEILAVSLPGTSISVIGRVNAGTASGMGADASISYLPIRALSLQASIGWNDLQFDEDILNGGLVLLAEGTRPSDSPEWTGSVNANYRVGTAKPGMDFVMNGNFSFGSERFARALSSGAVVQTHSDDTRRLQVGVGVESDRWSLKLFGDNLLNDDGATTAPNVPFGMALRLRPRTVGLQATYSY